MISSFAAKQFLAVLLCVPLFQGARPSVPTEDRKASDMRRSLDAWIECDDCKEDAAAVARKWGLAAVPLLAAFLHDGPPPERRELARRHLLKSWQDLKDYEKEHPQFKVPITEDDYVRTYLENLTARYQVGAAAVLAAIGGAQARAALEDSLATPLRADVKSAVSAFVRQMKKR